MKKLGETLSEARLRDGSVQVEADSSIVLELVDSLQALFCKVISKPSIRI